MGILVGQSGPLRIAGVLAQVVCREFAEPPDGGGPHGRGGLGHAREQLAGQLRVPAVEGDQRVNDEHPGAFGPAGAGERSCPPAPYRGLVRHVVQARGQPREAAGHERQPARGQSLVRDQFAQLGARGAPGECVKNCHARPYDGGRWMIAVRHGDDPPERAPTTFGFGTCGRR